jgi:Xaa-Pro aminopeptidase
MGVGVREGNPSCPVSVSGVKAAGKGRARMIYAASENNADMLYATGVFVPDPFVYIRVRGKAFLLVSDMEYARVKREARADRVFSHAEITAAGAPGPVRSRGGIPGMLTALLDLLKVGRIEVPVTFPLGLADELRKRGFAVYAGSDPFFPGRGVKSERERGWIRRTQRAAEHGMREAWSALKDARTGPGKGRELLLGGAPLTSERMRCLVQKAILERQCVASQTIVAGGTQGADPHERGHGVLRAGQPIIIDIFPRCEVSGYHGDMTRTFVKGVASERVRSMYHAVKQAQTRAISMIRPGMQSRTVHRGVLDLLGRMGFPKDEQDGRMVGFIHGTGHGLGLDVHEHPSVGERSCRLEQGNVVTIEPGLYYPDVGGVRIEDVVWIGRNRAKKLVVFPSVLEVP